MNRIDKFRGILEIKVDGETYILNSLTVNDLFDLLLLRKKDNSLEFGVGLLYRIFSKSLPKDIYGLEGWIVSHYTEIIEELIIEIGWITREKLNEIKTRKEEKKETSIALFKARLSSEVDCEEIEDKYITATYVIMREFTYTGEELLNMPATRFLILLDEMNKQNEKEKEQMNRNKTLGKH